LANGTSRTPEYLTSVSDCFIRYIDWVYASRTKSAATAAKASMASITQQDQLIIGLELLQLFTWWKNSKWQAALLSTTGLPVVGPLNI